MKKLIFADQLRSIAAFAVVFVHLGGGFWAWRASIAAATTAPIMTGPSSRMLGIVNMASFGPFGVSLFFLISGFVIPLSLEKLTPVRFLIARIFRIFPTYLICLAIGLFSVWMSSLYWHNPFPLLYDDIVYNALLLHTVLGIPIIDFVSWTLAVEIKFYLVMAIAALFSLHKTAGRLLIVAALIFAFLFFFDSTNHMLLLWGCDLMFIPYMLIGTMFSLHMRGKISRRIAISSVAALLVGFWATFYRWNLMKVAVSADLNVYVLNVGVFAAAYATRDSFKPNLVLDFMARISYPMYAIHALSGFVMLRILRDLNFPPMLGFALVIVCVVVAAYVIHRFIEVPTTKFGKWITQGRGRGRISAVAVSNE